MFQKRSIVWLGLATLVALAAIPASAQSCTSSATNSNVSYNIHYPVTQTIYDVCTARPGYDNVANGTNPDPNAVITLGGEFYYEWHCTTESNGDYHVHWTSHYNLKGTENGVNYIGKDTQNGNFKMDPDGTFPPVQTSDFTTSDKFKLIAQGPTPDMVMTQKTHVRVNASGKAVVDQQGPPVIKCTR